MPADTLVELVEAAERTFATEELACVANSGLDSSVLLAVGLRVGEAQEAPRAPAGAPDRPAPAAVAPAPTRFVVEASLDFDTVVLAFCEAQTAYRKGARTNMLVNFLAGMGGEEEPTYLGSTGLRTAYRRMISHPTYDIRTARMSDGERRRAVRSWCK